MAGNPNTRRFFLGGVLACMPAAASAQNADDFLKALTGQGGRPAAGRVSGLGTALTQGDIGLGLKDALKVATRKVVGQVGRTDGYFGDPAIRIPLPVSLERVAQPMRSFGAGFLLDDLSLRMNRAAEAAAPRALDIFVDAATAMSFDDARGILTGPQDSATQYFKRTATPRLTKEFRPIVGSALSGAGAIKAWQAVQGRVVQMPLLGQMASGFDLTDFTVGRALDGLFYYVASEERLIRTNPAARTTDLLRRVFN